MPRIPTYEQRTVPNSLGPAPRASGVPVASVASGLNDLGRTLGAISSDMFRIQEQQREDDAAIAATTMLAEGRLHFAKRLQELSDNWTPDAEPVSAVIQKEFRKWADQQIEAAGTEKARAFLRERTATMFSEFGLNAYKVDREKRIDLNVSRFETGLEAAKQAVFANPEMRDAVLEEQLAALDGLAGVDPGRREAAKRKLTQEIDTAAVLGARARMGDQAFFKLLVREVPQDAPKQPEQQATGAADLSILDPRQAARLASVKLTPEQDSAIEQAAGGDATKAAFLRAVVKIENRGNESIPSAALSKAGALGPFQFMPGTARQYGLSDEDRKDFGKSAMAAGKFYDDLYRMYGGNLLAMAAHYNGGFEAGRAVMEGRQPPAPETQEYVKMARALGLGSGGSVVAPTASVDGVLYQLRPADELPQAFRSLPIQEQFRLMQEAARGAEQERAGQRAGVILTSARTVVDSVTFGPDYVVDIPALKARAVAAARSQLGTVTPEQQEQIEDAVERFVADKERDVKRADASSLNAVFDLLDKNGGDWNAALAANPKLIGSLSRESRERASRYAGAVATGETRETDWQVYMQLVTDPVLLRSTNIDALRDKLNAKEYAQLKQLQQSLLNDGTAEQDIRSHLTVVKELLEQAKITNKNKQAQFFALLQDAINTELAVTGKKKLRQTEIKKLAADLLTEQVTSRGILWDSKERMFNITVPPQERVKIEAALVAEGLPVTDYNVLKAYTAKLSRQTPSP